MALLGSICTADDVRFVFGLESDELMDSTILSRATRVDIAIKREIPEYQTIIDNQGTDSEAYNKLVDYVIYTSADKVLPSLALTLENSVRDDSGAEGSRYDDISEYLKNAKTDIQSYLGELRSDLNGTTTTATLTIMGRSVPATDIVTGQ